MSDESSNQTSAADSTPESGDPADGASGSSGGLEPNGGPRRVVSDQSVDDILNSLDETKTESEEASSPPATESATSESATDDDAATAETDGDVTTEFDEDEIPAADDQTDTDADSADAAAANAESADRDDGDDGSDAGTVPSSDDEAVSDDDDGGPDIDELAARIEDGTVTGADVRAAEAGEGRESTPEVDEIELSMDDIEATQGASGASQATGGTSTGVADDAGPLAGSIQREEDGDSSDGEDDSPGLFGRIKRFFGG